MRKMFRSSAVSTTERNFPTFFGGGQAAGCGKGENEAVLVQRSEPSKKG